MSDSQQPSAAEAPATKKAYHAPDLRDYGTVKELTLTGGTPGGVIDNIQTPDYATAGAVAGG